MPVDVRDVRYDAVVVTPGGWGLWLWTALERLEWEEEAGGLAGRLALTVRDGPAAHVFASTADVAGGTGAYNAPSGALNALWVRDLFALGSPIVLYAGLGGGQLGFDARLEAVQRYTITGVEYADDRINVTAHDALYALAGSAWDNVFTAGVTGRAVITTLAGEFGLTLGDVRGPDVPLPAVVCQGTLAGTVVDVLALSYLRGPADGPRWLVRATHGAIDVLPEGANAAGGAPVLWFHPAANLDTRAVRARADIAELVTEVQISSGPGRLLPDVDSAEYDAAVAAGGVPVPPEIDALVVSDLLDAFGRRRAVVRAPDADSVAAAQREAADLIATRGAPRRSAEVAVPDHPFLRRGDVVRITSPTLDGRYVVAGVTHAALPERTMTLTFDDSGTIAERQRRAALASGASPGASPGA